MRLNEVYRNSGLGKWFHGESATKEPGWDRYNSEGKRVGKCGDAKEGSAYSACLSKQKAKKLGKKGRSKFVNRKRAAQNAAGRGEKGTGKKGKKPINVDTGASKMKECYECEQDMLLEGKNKPNDPEKWSACKSAAKSKFDVYPSAYANAWAAKCYKKKGGSWRSVNEEIVLKEIKENTKLNILNNFMENAKPEFAGKFARRGPGRQRPKSFGKGGKAGTKTTQDRREGKKQAQEMNEESGISSRLDKIAPNTTQERMKKFIVSKAQENLKRQRTLMGAPSPLNTEDTPGALHPTAIADIARGDTEKVAVGFRHLAGKILSSGARTKKLTDDLAASKRETAAAIAAHHATREELAALRGIAKENQSSAENAGSLFDNLDKPKSS